MPASVKSLVALLLTLSCLDGVTAEQQCAHLNLNGSGQSGAFAIVNANLLKTEKAQQLAERAALARYNKTRPTMSETTTYYIEKDIYQLAIVSSRDDLTACSNLQCDFSNCQPAWLCQAVGEQSMVSVSQRSTSLKSQFKYLKNNLDELLSYLFAAQVTVDERFAAIEDNQLQSNYSVINNQVDAIEAIQSQARLAGFCFTGNDTLFANFVVPETTAVAMADEQPLVGVGRVDKAVATGLISDKIELSVKRALIDLAKQKQITVSSNVEVRRSEQGLFKLTDVSNQASALLTGQLIDLRILPGENEFVVKSSLIEVEPSVGAKP